MAGRNIRIQAPALASDESDYGSDFSPEDLEVLDLLAVSVPSTVVNLPTKPSIAAHNVSAQVATRSRYVASVPVAYETAATRTANYTTDMQGSNNNDNSERQIYTGVRTQATYPDLSAALSSLESRPTPADVTDPELAAEAAEAPPDPDKPDTRSPLERYRTAPRKALSVTDLVSPAWCELQYSFTLALHGRKRPTKAMKQGSKVHQTLEEEVYTTVKVDVPTKEDAWALRVWNVIQGLRTLRETGRTRELEVWGVIDGEVVGGVIDEVAFLCPDIVLELKSLRVQEQEGHHDETDTRSQNLETHHLPTDHGGLFEYLHGPPPLPRKLYITDVKTRSVASLPRNASFRPTKLQLMLYHTLLSSMAAGEVDVDVLADRYSLDPHAEFSPSFIAQVAGLADEVFYDAPSSADEVAAAPEDAGGELARNNTLAKLWRVMQECFRDVADVGGVGRVLRAEYRSAGTGGVIGQHTFAMDESVLGKFLGHGMEWWRGERPAEGVVKEEAFKCRSCEFAESCEWRLAMVEEDRQRARAGWK